MFKKLVKFLSEVKAELKKVTWPNRGTVVASTWAVVFASVVTGIYIAVVDLVLAKVIKLLV